MYRERAADLSGAVLWQHVIDREARVLPDGCLDLMWLSGALVVAGPDTSAFLATGQPGAVFTGLRFAPGTGPAVLGVSAAALRDQRVPLADLWPAALVRELTERAADAPRVGTLLESIARDRLAAAGPPDPAPQWIAATLYRGATVAEVADRLGYAPRTLLRRCRDAFGYGPKTLARILRLRRALHLARTGTSFATVAAQARYADQAHLAREVKALAGVPLGELIR